MKTRALSLVALLTVSATLALAAGGFNQKRYIVDSTNVAPTLATQGLPLVVNGQPITSISVTVADYNDGGADHEFVWLGDVVAHTWKSGAQFPDGGAGWMRAPQYDFTVDAGTSAGAPIQARKVFGHTVTFTGTSAPIVTSGEQRIYFQTLNVLGNDAGTVPVQLIQIDGKF